MSKDNFKKELQSSMGTLSPLKPSGRVILRRKPTQSTFIAPPDDHASIEINIPDLSHLPIISSNDFLSFRSPGQQTSVFKKMSQDQYNSQNTVDLHGLTAPQALAKTIKHITKLQNADIHNMLLIHGKGHHQNSSSPILKATLNYWLPYRGSVLAFCSAKNHHGGNGALYVLLKKLRI